jgi:hypothetical protein
MNRKQLGILFALLIVLGGVGLVSYRNQVRSWTTGNAKMGAKLLGNFPVNEVTQISISRNSDTLNLVRDGDGWRVAERNNYPANFSQIRELLLKARDLKIVQCEQVGPSQLARLQLAPPGQGTNSALAVEFKGQDGKAIKTLQLGKQHLKKSGRPSPYGGGDADWPDGRYVKVNDSDEVAVVADPLENIEPRPDGWLNKDFIRVDKAKTIAVTFPEATNSWSLTRDTETGDWKLADAKPGERLDINKAAEVSNPLASPSFVDVAGAVGAPRQPTVVAISTFDGFQYHLNIGPKTNEEYRVVVTVTAVITGERTGGKDEKPEEKIRLDQEFKDRRQKLEDKLKQEQGYGEWTYLVASWVMDPVLKERSQLLTENKPESKEKPSTDTSGATGPKAGLPGVPVGSDN